MRVFINPMAADGTVIGNGGPEGAFCPRVLVRDAVAGTSLLPIPDGITYAQAALVEPLAVALHGVNRGDPAPGGKVAVFGCGPIGLGAVLWLKRRGVSHVVAVDISPARLGYAAQMGADATINPLEENVANRLRMLHGDGGPGGEQLVGTDLFLDMAGAKTVIPDILAMAKRHARLVVTAIYMEPIPVDFTSLILREVEITTAGGYSGELQDVMAQLPDVDPAKLAAYVSHTFPFEQFDEAFAVARQPESAKVMVTFGAG
jgi:threonine dehydrogenase-like Zn-dependent dehydrogenase